MEKSYSEWGKHKRGIVFVECCGIMRQPKHFFISLFLNPSFLYAERAPICLHLVQFTLRRNELLCQLLGGIDSNGFHIR